MKDDTEGYRREKVAEINSAVKSNSDDAERSRLEAAYGKVWNTEQLWEEFKIVGFMAPFCTVIRKEDNQCGSVEFQHHPRFYFNFREE